MSRQKSGRGANTAKAKPAKPGKSAKPKMASAAGGRGVYVQSPKSDVYVTILGISLAAMLLACLFMFLVWQKYEMKLNPTAALAQIQTTILS